MYEMLWLTLPSGEKGNNFLIFWSSFYSFSATLGSDVLRRF